MFIYKLHLYVLIILLLSCENITDSSTIKNTVYIDDISENSFNIKYTSNISFAGFQFSLSGIDIISVSSNLLSEENFTISYGPLSVVGYSLDGSSITPGSGILATVIYNKKDFISCMKDLIIVDISSNILDFEIGGCIDIQCNDLDLDLVCDSIDDCIGLTDICGLCNGPGLEGNLCDCFGNIDIDQDGICDNIDVCIGETNENGYLCSDIHVLDDFRNLNFNLKELNINDIGIQFWVDGRLERLYLYNLNLTDLPSSINKLEKLKKLLLNNNNISILPNNISYLDNLEDLILDNNEIIDLPNNFTNLNLLKNLKLNDNTINYLPENIGNMISLEKIELKNNKLSIIPDSISDLINLERLWLDNNELITLPNNLCNLVNCDIDVNGNNLCEEYYFYCIDDLFDQNCNE